MDMHNRRTFARLLGGGAVAAPVVIVAKPPRIDEKEGVRLLMNLLGFPEVTAKPPRLANRKRCCDVSCPIGGALCETLYGEVEIWGPKHPNAKQA